VQKLPRSDLAIAAQRASGVDPLDALRYE